MPSFGVDLAALGIQQVLYFSYIGFGIPAVLLVFYTWKTLKSALLSDWLIFVFVTLITYLTVFRGPDNAIHMAAAYIFACIGYFLYAFNNQAHAGVARPAGMLCALFFVSKLIPDIIGAVQHDDGTGATVGGAAWVDGLLTWPIGASLLYALALWTVARTGTGKEFIQYHFGFGPVRLRPLRMRETPSPSRKP